MLGRVEVRLQTRKATPVLEIVYTGILVLVFLFVAWFSVYVVYKLYEGQR